MSTATVAEVLKLASKPVQHDNDEITWLEFRFKLENYLTECLNRNGFEAWRKLAADNAPNTAGRRFAMLQAVLQPVMSDNPAKFEEMWKS